jgi:hypothetical protein
VLTLHKQVRRGVLAPKPINPSCSRRTGEYSPHSSAKQDKQERCDNNGDDPSVHVILTPECRSERLRGAVLAARRLQRREDGARGAMAGLVIGKVVVALTSSQRSSRAGDRRHVGDARSSCDRTVTLDELTARSAIWSNVVSALL